MIWKILTGRALLIRPASGLGNQLFLYSAGRYIQESTGKLLYIDTSRLDSLEVSHGGSLRSLNLTGDFVSLGFSGKVLNWFVSRIARFGCLTNFLGIFVATNVGYQPALEMRISRVRVLEGFFMCDQYISAIELRTPLDFELTNPSSWFLNLKRKIEVSNSIIIHVRRGDFLVNPDSWGILAEQYYLDALSEIRHLGFTESNLFILSDNPELVRAEFKSPAWQKATYLDTVGEDPAEVMKLFSVAKIVVIGNSTFSWWGSRIGHNELVICPKPFYKSSPEFEDLYRGDMNFMTSVWAQSHT